jgi:hypothetical protein
MGRAGTSYRDAQHYCNARPAEKRDVLLIALVAVAVNMVNLG